MSNLPVAADSVDPSENATNQSDDAATLATSANADAEDAETPYDDTLPDGPEGPGKPVGNATPAGPALPKPGQPVQQTTPPPADYRLFFLNNQQNFRRPDGSVNVPELNARFFQTVRDNKQAVRNVSDTEFAARLKKGGIEYPKELLEQGLRKADKGYADLERGRFNTFANSLRNRGLDNVYNRRRGLYTAKQNVDTSFGDEVAQKMGMRPRTMSAEAEQGYTARDQVAQYYDQSNAARKDASMPFEQTELESQKARDFYQGGDHEVLTGYTDADGQAVVRSGTSTMPLLDPDRLYTSKVDPTTGMPRLVAWDKSSDPNRISGQAMNVQALLPKPPALTVARVVGDLIPVAGTIMGQQGTVWTGSNQTLNRTAGWVADKVGYDATRQDIESDGIGLGSGLARGIAAVGAGNERLVGFEKNLATGVADLLGDYNFTIGPKGFTRLNAEQEKARLRDEQRASYQKAAQVQGNLNTDQQGSMFSSLPAFFYNFSQQVGQQAIQQGLNTVAPGAGFAYMAGTTTEQGYSDARRAGLGEGASTALGGGLGMLTYATEKFFDIGIAKYGRKLIIGAFEAELGAELGQVLKSEKQALLDGVLADARKRGLQNLTAAQTTALVEKAAPTFLRNVQQRFNAAIQAAEKSAVGTIGLATVKETAQETLDQAAQTGAYSATRQFAFEDGHGKLKDDLAPWVKKSLEDGSNPLAEKSTSQILEEWYQAGLAGGLMGGVFSAPFARGMAKQATLAQAAQASAEANKSRQIATYLVEHGFTPKAADELRQELKAWHDKHQLGVRTKVDGTPASEDGSDSENTLVYQSLLNKVNVLQRLATDTNLAARLTPSNRPTLVSLLADYGNENVRTEQGLDTLLQVHEKQQQIQRLLTGQAATPVDPVTGEPAAAPLGADAPASATTAAQKLGLPGFDPKQGALGLSPEAYKLELDRRRALISQDDEEGKDWRLKELEEEAGRAQDSGALGVITRNRAVGTWYERSAAYQQLADKLAATDGSDLASRQSLRSHMGVVASLVEDAQREMATAVSQSADGSLSRIQQVAEAQLELNRLRTQSADVFNGNLVRMHLQEGYLRAQSRQLDELLTPEFLTSRPVYEQNFLRYQQEFLRAVFTDQPDGGVQAMRDYNLRRKEFIAQRQQEQGEALTQSQQQQTDVSAQLVALPELALAADPAALLATLQQAAQLATQYGATPELVAAAVTSANNAASALETQARQFTQDASLRAQTLQTLLDEENQQRRQAATAAGQNPDEVFTRTAEWVQEDPDNAADYDQKVTARLQAGQTPEVAEQLAQAAALREASAQLAQAPAFAMPVVDDESELERKWATHFAPVGQLISTPGAVETVSSKDGSLTGIPGRITALQNQLAGREGESEADYAARLATIDPREVAQLTAQAHYHLAQVQGNQQLNNLLLQPQALPTGADTTDLRMLPDELAQELVELYTQDYLPALDAIGAALASQSGSRYAKDDEHRAIYLNRRAAQLDAFMARTQVLRGNTEAERRLQQAGELLRQVQGLTASSRTPEVLAQGTTLLAQAEDLLRQAFEQAGPLDAQLRARQDLHQEVLAGIELKPTGEDPAPNSELREALQRYRQGLEYRGQTEDGVFLVLQQLFGINRATWSKHYASVVRQATAGTAANGLPMPAASLEQEHAVLAINAFFQGQETHQSFPADSVLGRHAAAQLDVLAKGSDAQGVHAIPTMAAHQGAFVSRHVMYVTGYPGAGKTAMVAGSSLATLASLRGATKENPLTIAAVAPHDTQRQNLTKALARSSEALAPTALSVNELLTHLKNKTLSQQSIVLDEGTILSGTEGNELFEHLETFNAARLNQGQAPVKVLVLGDPAQLAGKNQGGSRQAVHLFVKQREVLKYQLPTLVEIYRSGFVVLHQLQEELRNRILAPASAKDDKGLPLNANSGPVGNMAYSLGTPGQYNTLSGVQYQGEAGQRQQLVEHIKQLEAARAADPEGKNPESQRTLRVIVSENKVGEEVAALTAAGIANAASYVEKADPHGVLDVEKAQGQEFDYVYVSVSETEADKAGKLRPAPQATVRALNVAVSRAQRYVSVRLSVTEQNREAELNNQQSKLVEFLPETAEARTQRTQQKLALLDKVAEQAPASGPVPTASVSPQTVVATPAVVPGAPADEVNEADDEAESPVAEPAEAVEASAASPLQTTDQPVPATAVAAVGAAQQLLAESEDTGEQSTSGQALNGDSAEVEAETEDDQLPADDTVGTENPSARLARLIAELSQEPLDYLARLEAGARTLRREIAGLEAAGADPLVVAQAREVLEEVQRRADQLAQAIDQTKAAAVTVPDGYAAVVPAGATEPGQHGGVEVVLDAAGQSVSARVWKPEFDSDGNFTQLREQKLPATDLLDEQGQPKSELGKLRSVRRWLDGQVRDLEAKRILLEKANVTKLAAENKVILHSHVMEAVADAKAREQRLTSKNNFTRFLYDSLFKQLRKQTATGQPTFDGVLVSRDLVGVPLPSGQGAFQGNGQFYLVYHPTFEHGRVSEDTRRQSDQNIFTVRYQEAGGDYLDVGVVRNNGHEALAPGELHSGKGAAQPSALDTLLRQIATAGAPYALGQSLSIENFKAPGRDRGLVSAQRRPLAQKYDDYAKQLLGASKPYIVTITDTDNVRLGDYLFNNAADQGGKASLAGGTVIFTSQGLTHDQTTAVVEAAIARAQQEKWPNQRLVNYLLQEHNLEMDVQEELPLSLQDYLQAVQAAASTDTKQLSADFGSAAALDASLTTQRGLDKKGRTAPVFKQNAATRKANWLANPGGWMVKRSLFSMAQARPARFAQDASQTNERGELHPAAYKTYGLLNKVFNVLLDSGVAKQVKTEAGMKALVLTEKARKALTEAEAEHLQLILNEFSQRDRHLINDGDTGRSYETRYNHDLLRYMGYLNGHGPLKGLVGQAWDEDTSGTGKAAKRGKNEVQVRPSFVGKARGAFTKASPIPGLELTELLGSRRDGMTDPSFVVNLSDAVLKATAPIVAPGSTQHSVQHSVQQPTQQLHTNNQAVAQPAAQAGALTGGSSLPDNAVSSLAALHTYQQTVENIAQQGVKRQGAGYVTSDGTKFTGEGAKIRAGEYAFATGLIGQRVRGYGGSVDIVQGITPLERGFTYTVRDEASGQVRNHGTMISAQDILLPIAQLTDAPASQAAAPAQQASEQAEQQAGQQVQEPETTTEIGSGSGDADTALDLDFNLNETGQTLGDAAPQEFITQVQAAFGKQVPWAFNVIGDFQKVLGAVVGNVISVNQAANGLVDRRTIKHEMVHYALRIVSPAYRKLVLDDARLKLMPKQGVSAEHIAAMSDKQVEEWLSKHYESVYRDYERRAEVFKRRTKYVPDSILRLYRALRTIYDRFIGNPDFTERLFGDLEAGLFRGRQVQSIYRGSPHNPDGSVNLDFVDFNRNAAGQRQYDFLELEKVFGSPQRRQQALHLVTTVMQEQLNDYVPGKPYRGLAGALNAVRAGLLAQAEQTKQLLANPSDPANPFVLDNHSANPAVAIRTRNFLLVQPFQQTAGEVNGEQQPRTTTTPLDVIVEYLYPHLKVNNRYDEAADPYAQDGDEQLSGSDGAADSNGSSSGNKANNISSKAYYLEDKNKAARPGVELHLLLQTIPLYTKDVATSQYQRDAGKRTVDFRSVNAALRRAVADARQSVYQRGAVDVTLEDVRQALLGQFKSQEGRGSYATGNRRDALASVYLKLFGGVGQVNPDGTFASDEVPVQGHQVKLNGQGLTSTPFSMYQVAYPERAGKAGVNAAQLVNLTDEATAAYALHYQRMLSQLLGHYTSTQRREYVSVDLTDGARESKDTQDSNALAKRKNYNQQALLNKFYKKDRSGQWQPSAAPLEALAKTGFTLAVDGMRPVPVSLYAQAGQTEPRIVLQHNGRNVLELGYVPQNQGGNGFTATGTWQAELSDQQRVNAAHQLLNLAGLPFDKVHLTEMLGTTGEDGKSSFQGFETFLGETLARVWTSALGDHALNGLDREQLSALGVQPGGPVAAYLTGALAAKSEHREAFGNWDDLNAIDGQGFDQSRTPQFRLSPTAHFSKVLGLAQYQNDWVRADVSDYTYSAEGQKIYLEQLGNGLYPRLGKLQAQRVNFAELAKRNWQPGQPKSRWEISFSPETGRVDTEVAAPFDDDLFGTAGAYHNPVADGSLDVNVLQVNGLTDARTGRRKAMVGATAAELHQLAVEHLFAIPLLKSAGKVARFFGPVISDKNTQRIFELSDPKLGSKPAKQTALVYQPSTPQSRVALTTVYQSYQAFLRHQVLPRYLTAGFPGLSEAAQGNDVLALQELQTWLSAQPSTPRSLVKTADHNGKGKLNQELVGVLTGGVDSFIAQAEADTQQEARRMHQDGYTFMPKDIVDALVNNGLVPRFDQQKFATASDKSYLTRAADGDYHPLLLTFANSAFIHGHALQTALDGHHLNYKGAVDRAKRGIISATNYESYDVHTPRGLGQTSKLLVLEDLSFASIAEGQAFGLLEGYERYKVRRDPNKPGGSFEEKEAQDGQGYMSPLHAMLEDESLGGKYMRLATPDEMQALGYERTAFPRKISLLGTRKNIYGDGHTATGQALLVKDSKTILTNNYLANANEKAYDLISKMLGGYDSPLYQRWRQLHDAATPEQLAANADWVQLYDEFIQPENRAQWEPFHHGIAAHPSAVKVGLAQVMKFGEQVAAGQVPHIMLDNRFGGKVLNLAQDPAGADISRITQEDHIISLLGENFQTAQQVYSLLGQLATDGLFDLQKQVATAGGEKFFMARLQDLLLNLGNVSNTLSLVRAGADPNVPLLLQPLHSAISSSIKSYSTKLRNKGLRATVQSSTGLVQMYNVLDAETGEAHRLPKKTLVKWGYATVNEQGQLVPTAKAAQLETEELKFMHLRELESGRELSAAEARAFMQRRLAVLPGQEAAFEAEARGKYLLEPMELLIPRDFVKAFNIPADWDVADVNRAGAQWFIDREAAKPGVTPEQAQELGQEKWQNWQDVLYVKGTRIPVTNMNSIQMGRVVGFHDGSQNVALVPSEMLLIAGADNDGDMITLEFLDLDNQGLRHRDQLDENGQVKVNEKGLREEILTSKRDNVLLNPFNVDQLFKPIDLGRFDSAVAAAQAREGELRQSGEQTGYALPTGGAARYAENIGQWITNQAGKSGVGPMVKAREAYNALHNYARQLGGTVPALATFNVPSYWLGREVSSPLDNPREVSYLFEDFANAALDNAKENYLGNLNFSQETWGVYSALIMTRQNFADMMQLMTHPYARRIVRRVQQSNKVSDKQRQTLQGIIQERLTRTAPTFDEAGQRNNNGKSADGNERKYTGYGYSTENGSLFDQVQARQVELHQSGQFPNLEANVGDENLSEREQYDIERYILENLYLNAVRGDELLAAQGILATMDGVNGPDYDNQRGLEKLLTALPLSQAAFPGAVAGDPVANLQAILDADPAVQVQWATKHQAGTKTINATALVANNPFVQSSIRAMLQDKAYKQHLFVARQPALQAPLQNLIGELSKHNGGDKRAAHKLVMRALDDYITQDFLQSHMPLISAEAQEVSPHLAALARQDVSTVNGRTKFGMMAAAYVEELKARPRNEAGNPGAQDSPLVQELTITGGNYGQAISLNNAADLDPENKQVLESLFSELGDTAKYGVEGPALQQVLLYYNLSRNGLHLGKGSLAEVLNAESLQPVSDHARQLRAEQLAQQFPRLREQVLSLNPTLTTELRAVKELPEGMEPDPEAGVLPDTSARYFFADPSALPDSFTAGWFRNAARMGDRNVSTFPEFAHIKNEKSPGKAVLYRRTGPAEKPVWRRQYSAVNPAVNNYGEYGYSPLPILEGQNMWLGDEQDDPVMQKLRDKAQQLGLVQPDGRFEVKTEGNRTWKVDRELRCQ